MATAFQLKDDLSAFVEDEHLELFSLIWLDAVATDEETGKTEQQLRSIINHLKRFQDVEECQEYIEQRSQKDRLILIVSGQMGRKIVPSIHKLRQIISIYVYCMDERKNKEWASEFKKIKAVFVELDALIRQIQNDHRIQKKVEESLPFKIFMSNKSTMGINGEFVFTQVLIDCLVKIKSNQTDRDELLELCRNRYKLDPIELSNIRRFEREYSSDRALLWYTDETFFYKTMNDALREQNIHIIFLFRSYISDIYHQLLKYQSKKTAQVYRCQAMSAGELKELKYNAGQLISVNSFFSTSMKREIALSFLELSDISDDLHRVLFEIDIESKMVKTKPFADISAHSNHPKEAEVLFMLGSIFRLKTVDQNRDGIWIVRMVLCSDDEHGLQQVFLHMKEQIGGKEINLRTLGNMLKNMGKFDLAEKYFLRLLKELPSNDPSLVSLYEDLAQVTSQKGDFDKSMQWHQKAVALKNSHQSSLNPRSAKTNNSIGKTISSPITSNTKWKQYGITIAGGNDRGDELNQLDSPSGIYVDDDNQCVYIADRHNHRIVKWKHDAESGEVVASDDEEENGTNKLNLPTQVILDRQSDSLIICDQGNRRVVQWSLRNRTNVQTIISDIDCFGLAMDNNGDIYVSDIEKHEVRRWKIGKKEGTIVAGGNGKGNKLSQLNSPTSLYVDEDHTVYVSDQNNHRAMKWMKGAKEGIVVAGGQGRGNSCTQLCYPKGIVVDHLGNVYVADSENHRLVVWPEGSKECRSIVGGANYGYRAHQFHCPMSVLFDQQGRLYVVDLSNNRVQRFDIDLN